MNLPVNNFKLGTVAIAAGSAVLLGTNNPVQAQFSQSESNSALRTAYSTVSVGENVNSLALEVILPDNVYGDRGSYELTFSWVGTNASNARIDQWNVNQGSLTETTAISTVEEAVVNAVNMTVSEGKFENTAGII
ncbi:MAG: hypothetical protein D6756_10505, partial [Cyanobacteria bacterium J083]